VDVSDRQNHALDKAAVGIRGAPQLAEADVDRPRFDPLIHLHSCGCTVPGLRQHRHGEGRYKNEP
jgi:hypothetical protein